MPYNRHSLGLNESAAHSQNRKLTQLFRSTLKKLRSQELTQEDNLSHKEIKLRYEVKLLRESVENPNKVSELPLVDRPLSSTPFYLSKKVGFQRRKYGQGKLHISNTLAEARRIFTEKKLAPTVTPDRSCLKLPGSARSRSARVRWADSGEGTVDRLSSSLEDTSPMLHAPSETANKPTVDTTPRRPDSKTARTNLKPIISYTHTEPRKHSAVLTKPHLEAFKAEDTERLKESGVLLLVPGKDGSSFKVYNAKPHSNDRMLEKEKETAREIMKVVNGFVAAADNRIQPLDEENSQTELGKQMSELRAKLRIRNGYRAPLSQIPGDNATYRREPPHRPTPNWTRPPSESRSRRRLPGMEAR